MATYVLGMNAGLYQGPAGTTDPSTMSEVDNVRDVTLTLEAGEADITTRGNGGWRATRAALRDASVEFELVWDGEDAALEAIRDAYLAGSELALAVMDGDIATVGSEGFCANFVVTGFNRGEPLEEAITVSVTAKPSSQQQWYEKAGV